MMRGTPEIEASQQAFFRHFPAPEQDETFRGVRGILHCAFACRWRHVRAGIHVDANAAILPVLYLFGIVMNLSGCGRTIVFVASASKKVKGN